MSAQLTRVLLVDDDPDILTVAQMALQMVGGMQVCACSSAQAGLDAARAFQPQLALLDVMMPDLDGPSMLARLRSEPETAQLPVIFLTAKAQPEEIERLRALGALAVIAKPFDPMKLADEVRAAWALGH